MSLKDDGFKFVLRAARWLWVHPNELRDFDIDCSNMNDRQFETFVKRTNEMQAELDYLRDKLPMIAGG